MVERMANQKTTVYLPDDLKSALERAAILSRRSEADLIREGVRRVTSEYSAPEPRLPLFESGDPSLSDRVDELLAGFGEE
jgi:Ribbon-helix-helix protein, copG family